MTSFSLVDLSADVEAGGVDSDHRYTSDHSGTDASMMGELHLRGGDRGGSLAAPSGPRSHGHRGPRARSPSPAQAASVMITPAGQPMIPAVIATCGPGPPSGGRQARTAGGGPVGTSLTAHSSHFVPMLLRMQPKHVIAVISALAVIGLVVVMTAVVSGGPTASSGHPLCSPETAGAVAFVSSLKSVSTNADRIRQSNAVRSWLSISPLAQVFIVGSEDVRGFAEELGAVRHCEVATASVSLCGRPSCLECTRRRRVSLI